MRVTPIIIFAIVVLAIVGVVGIYAVSSQLGIRGTTIRSDPSALEIHILVYPNPYFYGGESYDADVWEFNPLSVMNNVSTAANWEPRGLVGEGCDPGWPVGVELLKGHYAAGNLSLGSTVLQNLTFSCPSAIIATRYLAFLPNSSSAIIKGPYPSGTVTTRRTWTYNNLAAGEYTVVARDEWGHVALGYFTWTS